MANNDIIVSEMTPASQINTGDLMIMTQPDSQSETGYSTKSGTVLQVSNKMLKGTNYETDLPSFANKNVLGGLEELKGDIFNLLPVDEASGSIANFETELAAPLQSVLVNVLATGGNGTPDNPNPIVGYSSANITRCGVNFFSYAFGETLPASGTAIIDFGREITFNGFNIQMVFSGRFVNQGAGFLIGKDDNNNNSFVTSMQTYVDANGNALQANTDYTNKWCCSSTSSTVKIRRIYFYTYPSFTDPKFESVMCEGKQTPSTYTPYNGTTVTISFGQTVYGGVLDVTRGKLTVTHAKYVGTWGDGGSEYLPPQAPSVKRRTFILNPQAPTSSIPNNGHSLCNVTDTYSTNNNLDSTHYYVADNLYVYLPIATSDDTAIECSYVIKEPFDIDLTPEVISAVVGENNVFAGCGGDTSVKFKDTIQHYIDKKIAQTQALIL